MTVYEDTTDEILLPLLLIVCLILLLLALAIIYLPRML